MGPSNGPLASTTVGAFVAGAPDCAPAGAVAGEPILCSGSEGTAVCWVVPWSGVVTVTVVEAVVATGVASAAGVISDDASTVLPRGVATLGDRNRKNRMRSLRGVTGGCGTVFSPTPMGLNAPEVEVGVGGCVCVVLVADAGRDREDPAIGSDEEWNIGGKGPALATAPSPPSLSAGRGNMRGFRKGEMETVTSGFNPGAESGERGREKSEAVPNGVGVRAGSNPSTCASAGPCPDA